MKTLKIFALYLFSLFFSALIFSGCAKNKEARAGIDPLVQLQAAPEIAKSFEIKSNVTVAADRDSKNAGAGGPLGVDNSHLSIKKTALGKEFLFSVSLLSQTPTPMFKALQSRIVSFIFREQRLYLLDVTKTNVVSAETNIPQSLLIAEFPIISDSKDSFEIDFNAGMRQIFRTGDMVGSEDPDSATASYILAATGVRLSYLDEITMTASALFIRQIAQIDGKAGPLPVEVRYQIKPYLPDPEFVPMESPGIEKVGYFEANPLLLADGSTRVYAMKWNEKKAIKFAISANTPVKYRKLVRDALLYWNKILGDKAIEVIQLEDKSITAPRFDLNIVQWADWDTAGYAYADAHVDPRSGEVLSAQIFIPSSFTVNNAHYGARLAEASRPLLELKGFAASSLCNRNLRDGYLGRENNEGASAAATEKATRDFFYETVAHELGHVLGLRHNFAGSLDANYDFKSRKKLITSYYKNMKAHPGVIASNSVMDYSKFEESSWNGDLLQNGAKALAYDDMAIKHLYFKTALPETKRPKFCTDDHVEKYADCSMFDSGNSVVAMASGEYEEKLKTIAAQVINKYIFYTKVKNRLSTSLVTVAEVNLNAESMAKSIGLHFGKLLSLLKSGTQLIGVRSQYYPVLSTSIPDIEKAEASYLASEFTRLGGIETLTKEISDNFEAEFITKFSELLDNPLFNSGKLADSSEFSFTSEEKEIMKKQVALFAPQMREQLILNEIKALSGDSDTKQPWMNSDLTYELASIVAKRFAYYAFAKTPEKLTSEITLKDGTKKLITLPKYRFPENIRLAAPTLLSSKYKAADGDFLGKMGAAKMTENELAAFGDIEKVNMLMLERPVLQWLLIHKKIAGSLR